MPTLEDLNDFTEDQTAIIEWAKSPEALEFLQTLGPALDPTQTQVEAGNSLAVISTSEEGRVSIPTVPDGAHTYAQLSGASRMENSGNTYTIVHNYFNDRGPLPRTVASASVSAVESPVSSATILLDPETPTTLDNSPEPGSSKSPVSSVSARPFSQHGGNFSGKITYSTDFISEREDGCYLETITPTKGNIPFHPDTEPHIRAYMSSSFRFGAEETLVPLWTPRDIQFSTEISRVGMIGDVGYFDQNGGFHSLFNIFFTREENESHGYSPPTEFNKYADFQVRTEIIKSVDIEPSTPLAKGWVDYAAYGKFRPVDLGESSKLSFCSEPLVTSASHGSVVAYHSSILGRLNERRQPARKEYIQHYLNSNAAQWYKYYNNILRQRPPLQNGSLMLVDISWSTDSCASAVFTREEKWELGKYFAHLAPHPIQPEVYIWDAHSSVKAKTSLPKENGTPDRSDHCIAIGVNAIFIGDPPGHRRSKMKRGLQSLSQSLSSMSIQSTISNSMSSILTLGRRRKT